MEGRGLENGEEESIIGNEAIGALRRGGRGRVAHIYDEPVVQVREHLHVIADEESKRHVRQALRVLLGEMHGRRHLQNADACEEIYFF